MDHLENHLRGVHNSSISRLAEIGRKPGPINGYARSIYYLVTGEKLELEIPELQIEQRENEKTQHDRQIHCYPNPSSDVLHIEIAEKIASTYLMTMTNLDGKTVMSKKISSNRESIEDVSSLSSGVYVLNITSSDEMPIYTQKIVILNQ